MDIKDLRSEIDAIDDQIVALFAQRMEVAAQVADYKKANNLPILVPARETEKLLDVAQKVSGDLAECVQMLYSVILPLSRAWQYRHGGNTLPFSMLSEQVMELYKNSTQPDHNEVV